MNALKLIFRQVLLTLKYVLYAVTVLLTVCNFAIVAALGYNLGANVFKGLTTQDSHYYMHDKDLPTFTHVQDFTPKKYYALVMLKMHGMQCSGAVISDDYVVTAAHCLMLSTSIPAADMGPVKVIGRDNRDIPGEPVLAEGVALNNSADYAIVRGDFKEFSKLPIIDDPVQLSFLTGAMINCGYPYGGKSVCYPTGPDQQIDVFQIKTSGRVSPGMSGGPVLDAKYGAVVGVNSEAGDGFIVISPTINIFTSLGIPVKL